MNRRRWLALALFWHLAPAVHAQAAINSGANTTPLPLRNLLIEVRQVQSEDDQQAETYKAAGSQAAWRKAGAAARRCNKSSF